MEGIYENEKEREGMVPQGDGVCGASDCFKKRGEEGPCTPSPLNGNDNIRVSSLRKAPYIDTHIHVYVYVWINVRLTSYTHRGSPIVDSSWPSQSLSAAHFTPPGLTGGFMSRRGSHWRSGL